MDTLLTAPPSPPDVLTLADLLEQLGGVSPNRVRLRPPPGTATEQDVIDIEAREDRLCELVDGVLVEKAMGFRESGLAGVLIGVLRAFVVPRNLGIVTGEAGMMRLFQGLVRIPDVAFVSWERIPHRRYPTTPIPHVVPDLAIEVLSESNTPGEMARKLREYLKAGVRLAWFVDPDRRTVAVYTSPEHSVILEQSQVLDGGDLLPGFTLPLTELFAELDRRPAR